MKTKSLLMLAAVGIMFLTSCKKDYVCLCTWTDGGGTDSDTETYTQVTKSDAKDACDAKKASILNWGGITDLECEVR